MTDTKTAVAVTAKRITGDVEYDKLVGKACELIQGTNRDLLLFYWKLGAMIKAATNGEKDGPRSVPQFLAHMQQVAPNRITLGEESLYNALKVNSSLSVTQLKLAQDAGVPLRNLLELCTKSTTPEVREATLQRVASGEVAPQDIRSEAQRQSESAPKTRESDGGGDKGGVDKRSSTIKIMRFPALLESVTEKVLGYAEALAVLCSEATTDEEIEKIQTAVRLADDYMDNLNTTFQAELEKGRKVMDRTITQMSKAERHGTKAPAAAKKKTK